MSGVEMAGVEMSGVELSGVEMSNPRGHPSRESNNAMGHCNTIYSIICIS